MAKTGAGPKKSECIKAKGLVARELLGKYECLWLFAKTQDAQSKDIPVFLREGNKIFK